MSVSISATRHQGRCRRHSCTRCRRSRQGGAGGGGTCSASRRVDHQLLQLRGPGGVLRLLLLLDQLLRGLEILQGDALRGSPRLPYSLGVGFPLDFMFFITNRRYKRSKYLRHVRTWDTNTRKMKK